MPTITPVQHCVPLSSPSSAVSSSGRGGKRQGAPPPASFGDAAKRAQSHGGHPANDSIRASGGLSSPISSATHGRCLFFCSVKQIGQTLCKYRLSHEAMTVFWVISAATYWASNGVKGKSDHPMPASDPPLAQLFIKEILMVKAPTIQAVISCSELMHDSGDLKHRSWNVRILSLILFHVTYVLDVKYFDVKYFDAH
uniref:Uncharacterized protein n=1 Tax=Oryza glumipatula TaxID=40148 RepID=A0A0E0AUL0_9ORYZ